MEAIQELLKKIITKYPRTLICIFLLSIIIILPLKLIFITAIIIWAITKDLQAQNITWKDIMKKIEGKDK